MVAFANSVRPGHIAEIRIGEKDAGTVQGVQNPDKVQKNVREEADKIYPAMVWRSQVYDRADKPCVRVEIEHSGSTPHFGGPALVRRGSETVKTSEEVFQRLIAIRSSKVSFLQEWLGTVVRVWPDGFDPRTNTYRWQHHASGTVTLLDVNSFYAVFQIDTPSRTVRQAEPLEKVVSSWDADNKKPTLLINQ